MTDHDLEVLQAFLAQEKRPERSEAFYLDGEEFDAIVAVVGEVERLRCALMAVQAILADKCALMDANDKRSRNCFGPDYLERHA